MRDKEFWHMPKSVDLHQAVTFLKGILENYNNKSWNHSVQDRMGSYLAKRGATKDGRNITPQRTRTMVAGIPQYFGFIYKNEETTPTSITVTKAGEALVNFHKKDLESYKAKNLILGKNDPSKIVSSAILTGQFKKLQLTNPNIYSECENILNFPLEITLLLLKEIEFISKAEIAMYLFKISSREEIPFYSEQIQNFRELSLEKRNNLIKIFIETPIGSKSLAKAATSGYFISLCLMTNFFKKTVSKENVEKYEKVIIGINPEALEEINTYLDAVSNTEPYDFGKDRTLWVDYFGNPETQAVPKDIKIQNDSSEDLFIRVDRNSKKVLEEMLINNSSITFPILENQNNDISVFHIKERKLILQKSLPWNTEKHILKQEDLGTNIEKPSLENFEYFQTKINEHISARSFDEEFLNKLSFLEEITGRNLQSNSHLRGSRFEYLFYRALDKKMKSICKPDEFELIWLGKLDDHGLPSAAPGGVKGSSDLKLYFDSYQIIFELTTIKAKSGQEKAEAISVPDHIKNHQQEYPELETIGIYLAPLIHQRITSIFQSNLLEHEAEIFCYEIENFLKDLLSIKDKKELIKLFKGEV